jgi:hypothetical protein
VFDFTEKDWEDIKFGVDNQVDFYAVSFVKDARVVYELKDYLKSNYDFCCLISFSCLFIQVSDSHIFFFLLVVFILLRTNCKSFL